MEYEGLSLSYGQLDGLSDQLGRYLQDRYALSPEDRIGVMLERSEWMVIALLSVIKTGCAYVPIAPSYPRQRIEYIKVDSGCKVCIDAEELGRFLAIKDNYAAGGIWNKSDENRLVYVLYTSGSTGEPKGCMLEHKGVVNRLEWMWRRYGFDSEDIVLQKTAFTFDVSVWELFLPLCWGCKMVICPEGEAASPGGIVDLIFKHKITCLHFVPSMLDAFLGYVESEEGVVGQLSTLTKVMASGEALGIATVRRWYGKVGVSLYNLYGPTEASIDVSYYDTTATDERVPIGRPVANTLLYILDGRGELVPVGVRGEIYIGGVQVARGYLNRAELTAERFVADPFRAGGRLYRTGDLGRWLADGNIEYLGRGDDQVKVRGYRIELGEVEQAMRGLAGMGAVVVVARGSAGGDRMLVGYFTSSTEQRSAEIRAGLLEKLPEYMVPGYFVQLERLPLTANGKVDKKALPSPEEAGLGSGRAYVAPRGEAEEKMVSIWQEVLKRGDAISTAEDFFLLGGHSLRAMQLISHYYREFGVKLLVRDMFIHTTIGSQAALLKASTATLYRSIEKIGEGLDYVVSDGQRRLWVLSQLAGGSRAYHLPGELELEGEYSVVDFERSIQKAIVRHEVLRTVFREGEGESLRQVVLAAESASMFRMSYRDFVGVEEGEIRSYVIEESGREFDLSAGPLLRAGLIRLGGGRYIFHYTLHHIISDGWSMELLGKEVLEYYEGYARGAEVELPALRIQYKDYAWWQQQQLEGELFGAHRKYWMEQFSGEVPVLELPSQRVRPSVFTHRGYYITTVIGRELTEGLRELSRRQNGTLFMGIVASLKALFYRYTGQRDMIIGSPVAGRGDAELEDQIGFYINTLALRTRLEGEDSFESVLGKVREVTLSAYEHQMYPFDRLVEDLGLRRDMSRSALFDVMVGLQNQGERGTG